MRNALVEANDGIRWVPEWAGAQRFRNWVENARDWVLSRQRFWGTPLPIWRCERCGRMEVIGSSKELEEKISTSIQDLHRPYIDRVTWPCGCGGVMGRVPDVMDVWLDAGSASWASLNYPEDTETFERLWPSDFITEGHDQTRGWFYSLLVLGLIAFNESPVKTILMHGFTLDAEGRGMHKSLGNVIYPEELLERFGVDATRIYLLKNTLWEDALISPDEIEDVVRDLNVVTNIYQFYSTYADLDHFRAVEPLEETVYARLMEEDRWILSKFEGTLRSVTEDMKRYHVHRALRSVLRFAVEDLSRRYVKLVRRRVWIEEESWEKTSVYITLHHILRGLAQLLAPFAPHFSEHYYQKYTKRFEDLVEEESIHLTEWPIPREEWIDEGLEERYEKLDRVVTASYAIRQRVGVKIRQPLKETLIPCILFSQFTERMISLLKDQANVLEVKGVGEGEEPIDYRVRARMDALGPIFKGRAKEIAKRLEEKPPQEILRDLKERGEAILHLGRGEVVKLSQDQIEILEDVREPYQSEVIGEEGRIYLNLELTSELLELGIVKDLVRRIQEARKRLNLEMMDPIEVILETPAQAIRKAVKSHEEYIKVETRAERILLQGVEEAQLVEEDTIDGKPIKIGLKR
jgi:isoleucyl-tRNA synthetase